MHSRSLGSRKICPHPVRVQDLLKKIEANAAARLPPPARRYTLPLFDIWKDPRKDFSRVDSSATTVPNGQRPARCSTSQGRFS